MKGKFNFILFPLLFFVFTNSVQGIISNAQSAVFLGIEAANISKEKIKLLGFSNPYGIYVKYVIAGTSADRAGIMPFDYIYGIDEFRMSAEKGLGYYLRTYYIGDEVTLYLVRKGSIKKIRVKFTKSENYKSRSRDKCQSPFLGISQNHSSPTNAGVRVSIINNSTAQALGLLDRDIITHINGYRMIDWQDITIAINTMNVGDKVSVRYLRDERGYSNKGEIKSYCTTKFVQSYGGQDLQKKAHAAFPVNQFTFGVPSSTEIQRVNKTAEINLPLSNTLKINNISVSRLPNQKEFHLSFSLSDNKPIILRIYSDSGRIVYSYELYSFAGDFEDSVNIAENGLGDYYLEIKQGTKSAVHKIRLE